MRTLFFRIFISFWLAMALILTGAIGVTAMVGWYRISMLRSIDPGSLVDEATTALRDHGMSGLRAWLGNVTRAHPDLDIYVIDASGSDILQRRLPDRVAQWLILDGRSAGGGAGANGAHNWPYGYDWAPGGVTLSHGLGFNGSHLLANPKILGSDGNVYTLLVAWFGSTPIDVLGSPDVTLLLFAVALGLSAVVSWWLAHYISEPVTKLQMSARTLALGNLDTQVDEQSCKRRDELGILAQDFNQMAARLRSQITSKETLLRDISHELRSPLTRLRVALGLAQRGDGNLGIQLERMERDIERLDTLIGETLQLSRLSSGEPPFACKNIELEPLLNELIEDAQLEASAAGIRIRSSTVGGLYVHGNSESLRRAVDNVLRNAARFAPPGSDVVVSTRVDACGVIVAVRDHGPGVPTHDLERIFEAFYRVDEARDRGSGGAGLGLAITARIMALHGGYPKARNAPKGGLIIELCFPEAGIPHERMDGRAEGVLS